MHAGLTNTVCTNIPDPVRERQAAGKQNEKEGEADKGESSAAPVDDEHTREREEASKHTKTAPPPRTPKKQTNTTDALQQQKGRQTKNARSTQPTIRTTKTEKEKKEKKERKGGWTTVLSGMGR